MRLQTCSIFVTSLLASNLVQANAPKHQEFTASVGELTQLLSQQVKVNDSTQLISPDGVINDGGSNMNYDTSEKSKGDGSSRGYDFSDKSQSGQNTYTVKVPEQDWVEVVKLMNASSIEQQQYIAERLAEVDNPEFILRELVRIGELALTPNEIRFILSAVELKKRALNTPLITPDVNNGLVKFNPNNRYNTYEFNVHESGITTLEFFDINGERWPIVNFTPAKGFNLKHGFYDNMLEIESDISYKQAYSYVHLDGFKNQIAIKLNYNNELRDGIRTFAIPFLYKINENGSEPEARYSPLSSIKATDNSNDSTTIPDLEHDDLMFIASLGYPNKDSKSYPFFKKVFVDKSEIAQIWRYGSKYIVRSRFQIMSHQYEVYVPSTDEVAVYVANSLDTIVDFNVGGRTESIFLPDYHLY